MLEGALVMVDKGRRAHHQRSYVECLCMCCLANLLGGGGVESVEALRLEGAPLSAALLTSALLILNCQVKPTRKSNKILSSELIHA